jgi:hypothetical protein
MSQQSGEGYVDEILGAGEIPWPGTEPRLSYVGGPPAPAIDPDKLANAETAAANGKVVKNHSTQGPQKKPSENVSLTPTTG